MLPERVRQLLDDQSEVSRLEHAGIILSHEVLLHMRNDIVANDEHCHDDGVGDDEEVVELLLCNHNVQAGDLHVLVVALSDDVEQRLRHSRIELCGNTRIKHRPQRLVFDVVVLPEVAGARCPRHLQHLVEAGSVELKIIEVQRALAGTSTRRIKLGCHALNGARVAELL